MRNEKIYVIDGHKKSVYIDTVDGFIKNYSEINYDPEKSATENFWDMYDSAINNNLTDRIYIAYSMTDAIKIICDLEEAANPENVSEYIDLIRELIDYENKQHNLRL